MTNKNENRITVEELERDMRNLERKAKQLEKQVEEDSRRITGYIKAYMSYSFDLSKWVFLVREGELLVLANENTLVRGVVEGGTDR